MLPPKKPTHLGHRKRLKKRLNDVGMGAFLNHEFLELLLTYSIARKDTKPIAWALLKRFGSIAGILDANESALLDVPGVGPNTVQFLKLIQETLKRYTRSYMPKRINIGCLDALLQYCQASLAGKQEEFVEVIFLSTRSYVICTRIMAKGSISKIHIEPRQIIEHALQEKACSLIIVHNHPSGDPTPSKADIAWTLKAKEAAFLFGIKIFDHLIVSKHSYYSFHSAGYLNYPKDSSEE